MSCTDAYSTPVYKPFQRRRNRQFFKSKAWLRYQAWRTSQPNGEDLSIDDARKLAESDLTARVVYTDLVRAELRRRGESV